MKVAVWIFLAGVLAAYLLDPTSGRDRRARVNDWVRPVGSRLRGAKDRAAGSETLAQVRESAAPAVAQKLKDVATAVQGGVVDASSTLATRAGRAVGLGNDAPGGAATTDGMAPSTAEVAPRAVRDPIPEGTPNDPTLVSRVESELFRDGTLPKGKLNVDAANGVVTLRGSLEDGALADDIVERTRVIEGVVEVVDLLQRR